MFGDRSTSITRGFYFVMNMAKFYLSDDVMWGKGQKGATNDATDKLYSYIIYHR